MAPRKPKLPDLSRESLSFEEVNALLSALSGSPPIVTAILGAGLIEHWLDLLLRERLSHRDDNTWAEMTGDRGPLGTLSQKILAGYALGIYGDAAQKNLNIVRQIRNAFAHTKRLISFDHPLVLAEIKKIAVSPKTRSQIRKSLQAAKSLKHNGTGCYVILCTNLTNELLDRASSRSTARRKYRAKRHAKWRADNPLGAVIFDSLMAKGEAIAAPPQSTPALQSGGPTAATPKLVPLSALAQLAKLPRNKDT